jgi:hypothetical protein
LKEEHEGLCLSHSDRQTTASAGLKKFCGLKNLRTFWSRSFELSLSRSVAVEHSSCALDSRVCKPDCGFIFAQGGNELARPLFSNSRQKRTLSTAKPIPNPKLQAPCLSTNGEVHRKSTVIFGFEKGGYSREDPQSLPKMDYQNRDES